MISRVALLGLWAVCQIVNVIAAIWMLFSIFVGGNRAWRLAVAYDQLANVAFGGHEDETICSRAYRAKLAGKRWGEGFCAALDLIQPGHCENSAERRP